MSDGEKDRPVHFRIEVPAALENGQFANFLSVWSGPHEFTLDFAVTGQPEQTDEQVVVPTRVVSRIKVPLSLADDILRALAQTVTQFESAAGRIYKPGDNKPLFPPEDSS